MLGNRRIFICLWKSPGIPHFHPTQRRNSQASCSQQALKPNSARAIPEDCCCFPMSLFWMLNLEVRTIRSFLSENLLPDPCQCPPWQGWFPSDPWPKGVQCVFTFHRFLINDPRKLDFILLAKMRVIRAAFDPFFSVPLTLQPAVKCDQLILTSILLCHQQESPTWHAAPPQELGVAYLRIWHIAVFFFVCVSGDNEKKCPPDNTMEPVPYFNIWGDNWNFWFHVKGTMFTTSLN